MPICSVAESGMAMMIRGKLFLREGNCPEGNCPSPSAVQCLTNDNLYTSYWWCKKEA